MGLKDKLKSRIADRAAKGTKKALDRSISRTEDRIRDQMGIMNESFSRIIDNQNDQTLAIISLYNAVAAVAVAQKVTLPEPLIPMIVEGNLEV